MHIVCSEDSANAQRTNGSWDLLHPPKKLSKLAKFAKGIRRTSERSEGARSLPRVTKLVTISGETI